MSKELCISSTPHETRLAIVEDDQLTEIYYERENEYTLAGSIYKGRVTRVLPGMQSAFVDIGLERDAFLYVTDFLEEAGEGTDSADFEKPSGNGSSGRREGRPPRAPREAAEGRGNGRIQVEPVSSPDEDFAESSTASSSTVPSGTTRPGTDASADNEEFDHGTRKWRGRRGRRRGFRGGQREGVATAPAGTSQNAAATDQDEPETPFESGLPISASVEAPPARPSFSPREREPRRDSFQAEPAAAGKPVFLPGESLSRYGHQPAPATTAAVASAAKTAPAITSRPSTIVEGTLAWDGISAALPGESLSRHKNRSTPAATPSLPPSPAPTSAQETSGHDEPQGHALVAEPAFAEPAFAPAVEHNPQPFASHFADLTPAGIQGPAIEDASAGHSSHPSNPMEILHAVHTPGGVTFEEVDPSSASTAPHIAPAPLALEEIEQESGHLPALSAAHAVDEEAGNDPEPEHASASYRVNPTPIEYRLASPVEEPVEQEHAAEIHPETAHPAEPEPAPYTGHPALEAEAAPGTEPGSSQSADQIHAFAPGHGLLEEETIEEEEYDYSPLHAHADEHDLEEIEEETVDNTGFDTAAGSQLGELVRDEHIQRRVSADTEDDPEEDEFDESEEEDLEGPEEGSSEADEAHARAESSAGGFSEDDFRTEGIAYVNGESHDATAGTPVPRRDDGRRGRNHDRGGRRGSGQRGRSGGGHRHSAQTSDLPIISDLLKQGQEVLVQIAKEPIAKKGARITSHIALPGRFLVFMPTVNHVGVSRKISSDEERLRLKRVLTSEKGTAPGGFIVRTAADGASEEELRADLRFLISLWTEIKQRSDTGKSPALIYHDLNLVERVLRDQVSDNFSTIWVDSEAEYERIVRFLNRFEPALVRRVKLYTKETPLFEQFGIQEEISKALKSKVWLKSGGSIVINQTEALVAIDINTGKYVGKTARLEDTIVKTNLDAIPEIVRQIRLRDLGGIIIIDFIDMDERKNRHRVMAALEEELKNDRAPSKVLQFNDFGLVAITRKRVKQSLERTLSTQCEICAGTGMVKSPVTVCNEIYTELRKMMKTFERGDALLRVHPEIVKTLKANNGKWLGELEEMIGRTIIVKSDPALHPEQFDIH